MRTPEASPWPHHHVTIEPDGPMWMLHLVEIDRTTEVRRLGQADAYIRSLVALFTDQPPETVVFPVGAVDATGVGSEATPR